MPVLLEGIPDLFPRRLAHLRRRLRGHVTRESFDSALHAAELQHAPTQFLFVGDDSEVGLLAEVARADGHVGAEDAAQVRRRPRSQFLGDAEQRGVTAVDLAVVQPHGLASVLAEPVRIRFDETPAVFEAENAAGLAADGCLVAAGLAVGEQLEVVAALAHVMQQQARVEAAGYGHQHAAGMMGLHALVDRALEQGVGLIDSLGHRAFRFGLVGRNMIARDLDRAVLQYESAALGHHLDPGEEGAVAVGALLGQHRGDRGAVDGAVEAAPAEEGFEFGGEEQDVVVAVPVHVGEAEVVVDQLQAAAGGVVDDEVEVAVDVADEGVATVEVEVEEASGEFRTVVGQMAALEAQGGTLEQEGHAVLRGEMAFGPEGRVGRDRAQRDVAPLPAGGFVPRLVHDQPAHGGGDGSGVAVGAQGNGAVDAGHGVLRVADCIPSRLSTRLMCKPNA